MRLDAGERSVLKRISPGPTWARSIGPYKAVADRLVERGLVIRVKPPGGRGANMLALTEKGRTAIFQMEGPR